MKQSPLIKSISQKDNYTFNIMWNDGLNCDYRLSDLQKQCPCANCTDEITGKRLLDVSTVKPDLRAIRIYNVGRYAIRIQFAHGCSTGIYSFDMLRKLGM